MNFYTSISNSTIKPKKWFFLVLLTTFFISLFVITINFIVDPYNVTQYNLLNIKYKFARDDRTEKVTYFKTLERFDNIMIGSSRIYSMNPAVVSQVLGGTTYNFGVGTATIEDHLGILKYLEKEDKLPNNIIIGVDFYTFNPKIPPNGYFLQNKELNFLSYGEYKEDYISKIFSTDAFRASFKTLSHHLKNKNEKPRFDKNGWSGEYEEYSKRDLQIDLVNAKKELEENVATFLSNLEYSHIDLKRIGYYEELKKICKKHNINIYIFNTPLHPILLNRLRKNKSTSNALNEFVQYLSTFDNFVNLYDDKDIYSDLRNFHGTTHTSTNAGDVILKKVLEEGKNEKSSE